MRLVCLPDWHRRLLCAQIENRDALEVIQYWDNEDAVFYVDPPYVHAARASGIRVKYDCEMTDEQHNKLVDVVLACRGAVVLSGYRNSIYERLERAGWKTVDFQTACHAAGRGRGSPLRGLGSVLKHCARTETVWMNDRAVEMNCRSEGALL
jgi:DNA adenine methylase